MPVCHINLPYFVIAIVIAVSVPLTGMITVCETTLRLALPSGSPLPSQLTSEILPIFTGTCSQTVSTLNLYCCLCCRIQCHKTCALTVQFKYSKLHTMILFAILLLHSKTSLLCFSAFLLYLAFLGISTCFLSCSHQSPAYPYAIVTRIAFFAGFR